MQALEAQGRLLRQLRDVMARNRIYTATELVPMLHDRDVKLSASQVHRLVSGTPERLSLQVLSALWTSWSAPRPTW